jgi:hypothetical protein
MSIGLEVSVLASSLRRRAWGREDPRLRRLISKKSRLTDKRSRNSRNGHSSFSGQKLLFFFLCVVLRRRKRSGSATESPFIRRRRGAADIKGSRATCPAAQNPFFPFRDSKGTWFSRRRVAGSGGETQKPYLLKENVIPHTCVRKNFRAWILGGFLSPSRPKTGQTL